MHAIGWNGTSAGWLGFESDEQLCGRVTEATGIPACTSVLALNEIFRLTRAQALRPGDAVPRRRDGSGSSPTTPVPASSASPSAISGWQDNWSFAAATPDQLRGMTREVAKAKPDAITFLCTGLQSGPLVEELERETGIPMYDTIATVVWNLLQLAGADPTRIRRWGRLFREVA